MARSQMPRKRVPSSQNPNKEKPSNNPVQPVPSENVNIIREGLGFDISKQNPESIQQIVQILSASMSRSPYTSAEMLEDYVRRGFPDIPAKVIKSIDKQREHRQELEKSTTAGSEKRQNRAQLAAQVLSFSSVAGALIGGFYGVPPSICAVVVIVGVGGPNAATVLSRVVDKWIR